jgi:IS30 family transposase
MRQDNSNTSIAKWKQLNYTTRIKIEVLFKEGNSAKQIASKIGYSVRTVQRELNKGTVTVVHTKYDEIAVIAKAQHRERVYTTTYSADAAEYKAAENASHKGKPIKLNKEYLFARYIEHKIGKENYSPYAALQQAENDNLPFARLICLKTLYNYIDAGYFLNITNADLPVKKDGERRGYRQIRPAYNNLKGRSIEQRDKAIESRSEYGHWEMDTVVGANKSALLVLTERQSREEIITKLYRREQRYVIEALNKLERKLKAKAFKNKFKTITMDNGGEFLDGAGIEKSSINKGKRTEIYYCHPYSAWERGSNENANKLIRRFVPKGTDINKITPKRIKEIETWINNYPRKILAGKPARQSAA